MGRYIKVSPSPYTIECILLSFGRLALCTLFMLVQVYTICVPQILSRKQDWHWTAGIHFASILSLLAPSPLTKQRNEMSFQLQIKALVGTHIMRVQHPILHPKAAFELILHAEPIVLVSMFN